MVRANDLESCFTAVLMRCVDSFGQGRIERFFETAQDGLVK